MKRMNQKSNFSKSKRKGNNKRMAETTVVDLSTRFMGSRR